MLLFIALCDNFFIFFSLISKHLMLLFIKDCAYLNTANAIFQNISCYCLSRCLIYCNLSHSNFKTSHVIVYQIMTEKEVCLRKISKHLMLLFILHTFYVVTTSKHFKTSHVIVYRSSRSPLLSTLGNFKTSHVIVYRKLFRLMIENIQFQNISCYCLSLSFPRF